MQCLIRKVAYTVDSIKDSTVVIIFTLTQKGIFQCWAPYSVS